MNIGRLYVFTAEGKCHQIKVLSVPMGRYNDKGVPLESVSALTQQETVISVISDLKPRDKLLFATKNGLVKKVQVSEFDTSRRTTDATKLGMDDLLIAATPLSGKGDIVLITKDRLCVSFEQGSISALKRNSLGVIGIKLNKGDEVVFADAVDQSGKFTFDEKEYALAKLDVGKRATKGKSI